MKTYPTFVFRSLDPFPVSRLNFGIHSAVKTRSHTPSISTHASSFHGNRDGNNPWTRMGVIFYYRDNYRDCASLYGTTDADGAKEKRVVFSKPLFLDSSPPHHHHRHQVSDTCTKYAQYTESVGVLNITLYGALVYYGPIKRENFVVIIFIINNCYVNFRADPNTVYTHVYG